MKKKHQKKNIKHVKTKTKKIETVKLKRKIKRTSALIKILRNSSRLFRFHYLLVGPFKCILDLLFYTFQESAK